MTTGRRHRRHTAEFKLDLVNAYLREEGSLSSIAKANDISHTLLRIWVDKYRTGDLSEEFDRVERDLAAKAKIEYLKRTIVRLRREVAELKGSHVRPRDVKSQPRSATGMI